MAGGQMKFIFLFMTVFFCLNAVANSQVYRFGTAEVEFWNFEDDKISVSSHCIKNSQLKDCDAIRGIKIVSFKRIERAKFGGINPGAMICEQQLNGFVMVGIDTASQNENSFCKLPDGSIIDNGTLISYGIKNDRAEEREPNSVKSKKSDKKTKKK